MSAKLRTKLLAAATGAALVATIAGCSSAQAAPAGEKCYGIAKKGMNDCGNSRHSCAGQATKSRQADEWIMLPKGVCSKIAGGSTVAPAGSTAPAKK